MKWVIDKLKGALEKRGHGVKMVAYESRERDSLPSEDAKLFGIAFPAYEGDAPLNIELTL